VGKGTDKTVPVDKRSHAALPGMALGQWLGEDQNTSFDSFPATIDRVPHPSRFCEGWDTEPSTDP
jgi:hypothetical protein